MELFVFGNERGDKKGPALAVKYAKAVKVLSLGSHGAVWKITDPSRIPEDVAVWRAGQCPSPTRDAIMKLIEDGVAAK
jgi:hypothetical protein